MPFFPKIVSTFRKHSTAYILLAPAFIALILVIYYPMCHGIWIALHRYKMLGHPEWTGLGNFKDLFGDPLFHYSLGITLVFLSSTLALQLLIGLSAALVLNKIKKFTTFFVSTSLVPYMIPPVAAGLLWYWMLNPDFGFVNQILERLGFSPVYFLSDGKWPIFSIILAEAWADWPYVTIIYLAALDGIPLYLYEVASIDGAGPIRRFWFITLPHLKRATIVVLAIRTVWDLIKFALPFELTAGGPGTRTTLFSILLHRMGFIEFRLGKAYAVGIVMILISIACAAIYINVIRTEEKF